MSKVIMFDIDGVLADFIAGFTYLASTMSNGVPVTLTSEQPSWNGFPGMDKHEINETWSAVKKDPRFWYSLPPLIPQWEFERIAELTAYHQIYFVTSRVGIECKQQTEAWLIGHGIKRPTVVISKAKGEVARAIKADYSIDDKASNASCIAWLTDDKTKSYLLDRKYNQCPDDFLASSVERIYSVRSFLDIVSYGLMDLKEAA